MRVLQVGAATTPICGVRDYAALLAQMLGENGASGGRVWWERDARPSVRAGSVGAREWCNRVAATARTAPPDWLLWHYTPHMYGYRGIPYLVPAVAAGLRRTGVPVVILLHEIAVGWQSRGWRGFGRAAAHRLAVVSALRACRGVVVTTEDRQRWLEKSVWLPHRPLLLAPVFSSIPVTGVGGLGNGRASSTPVIGVFGYGGFGPEEVLTDVIVGALADLKRQGVSTRLLLLGHPGPVSAAADRWRQATARVGIDTLEFTGVLEPEALSHRLREVDLMILPDRSGPTGRKATLAASLAHGLPVVGFEARTAWRHLANEGAVRLAPKTDKGLAQALKELLQNDDVRVRLGLRAGEYYRENVRPELMVRRLLGFLDTLSGRSEPTRRPATAPHVAGPRSGA